MTLAQAELLTKAWFEGRLRVTDLLTDADREEIHELNAKKGYSMDYEEFVSLVERHSLYRTSDVHYLAMIEYRLTDLNYHEEVKMLRNGEYHKATMYWLS